MCMRTKYKVVSLKRVINIKHSYRNIYAIDKAKTTTIEELKRLFPDKKICVCDFEVTGADISKVNANGLYVSDDLILIDHHADLPVFQQKISSVSLASKFVNEFGALGDDWVIVINHTDTDSVLSSMMMSGEIDPMDEFVSAGIAADHTGEQNVLADLLEANYEDDANIGKVVNLVRGFVSGEQKPIDDANYQQRVLERESLQQRYKSDMNTTEDGDIVYGGFDEWVDGVLIAPLFPKAKVIVIAIPHKDEQDVPTGKLVIKTRLGGSAEGINLKHLGLPDWGGRWNAGSTRYGTLLTLEEYVVIVKEKLMGKLNVSADNFIRRP